MNTPSDTATIDVHDQLTSVFLGKYRELLEGMPTGEPTWVTSGGPEGGVYGTLADAWTAQAPMAPLTAQTRPPNRQMKRTVGFNCPANHQRQHLECADCPQWHWAAPPANRLRQDQIGRQRQKDDDDTDDLGCTAQGSPYH